MKPMLKAPGTKRLKLKYDEPPSNFAFKFNLRRYSMVDGSFWLSPFGPYKKLSELWVGRCKLAHVESAWN